MSHSPRYMGCVAWVCFSVVEFKGRRSPGADGRFGGSRPSSGMQTSGIELFLKLRILFGEREDSLNPVEVSTKLYAIVALYCPSTMWSSNGHKIIERNWCKCRNNCWNTGNLYAYVSQDRISEFVNKFRQTNQNPDSFRQAPQVKYYCKTTVGGLASNVKMNSQNL